LNKNFFKRTHPKLVTLVGLIWLAIMQSILATVTMAQESVEKDSEAPTKELQAYMPRRALAYINLTGESIDIKSDDSRKKWKEICNNLGQNLRYKKSHIGFLAKYKCLPIGQKVPEKVSPNISPWNIQVNEGDDFITITVNFFSDGSWQKITEINFKKTDGVFKQFTGAETYVTIARILIDSLPVGWIFRPSDHNANIRFIASYGPKSLPEKLYVYTLSYNKKSLKWLPKIAAVLKSKGAPLEAKNKWAQTYEYEKIYTPINPKALYLVQNAKGLGKDNETLVKHLEKTNPLLSMINLMDLLTFNALSSNYVGLKYAKSLIEQGSVLSKVTQFSLLVEIRDGLFNGVRIYYEKIPKVIQGAQTASDNSQYIEMQRINAGWNFKLPLPDFMSSVATEISVQPKAGITDFTGSFSIPLSPTDFKQIGYELNGVLDLALELGIERETDWFRARLWGSVNTSAASKIASSAGSVTSIRAGLDSYWDVASFSDSITLNLLAFANYERLQLKKPVTSQDPTDLLGTNIGFNLALVGGGITLEW